MKRLGKFPEEFFLVTTDAVGLYPSIPHKGDFSIEEQIRGTNPLKIRTNDLVKLVEFPQTNNFFEFDDEINRSLVLLLGLTLVLHTTVFMNKTDIFLKHRSFNQLRYTDNIFLFECLREAGMKEFTKELNEFLLNLKFTYASLKK